MARVSGTALKADLAPGQWDVVVENLGLVHFVVNRTRFATDDARAEAEQDGVFGLLRAVQKYDPTLGWKFSTYAISWIRQSISRGIGEREGRAYRSARAGRGTWEPPLNIEGQLNVDGDEAGRELLVDPSPGPHDEALAQVLLEQLQRACVDDIDRVLVSGLLEGVPVAQLARQVGYSRFGLQRRLWGIRQRAGWVEADARPPR